MMLKILMIVMAVIQAAWAGAAGLHLAAEWRLNQVDAAAAAAIYPWDYKYDLILGVGNVVRGNLDQAIWRLERVVARAPRHVAALTDLGAAYAISGDKKRAESALIQALALCPGNRAARKNLDILRGRALGKYELALVGS